MKRAVHWSPEEIRKYSTERIFEKLHGFGIDITPEQFREEVDRFYGSEDLFDAWKERYTLTAEGFDEDFPWMAAIVLWERLAPDVLSADMLYDAIEEGYDFIKVFQTREACDLWLEYWQKFKERFVPKLKSFNEIEEVFKGGLYSTVEWLDQISMELFNASIDNPEYIQKRLEYCQDVARSFPNDRDEILALIQIAEGQSLFELERVEEGERVFQEVVDRYPNYAWGYINWGDLYWDWMGRLEGKIPIDYHKAETIYKMALEQDVGSDRKDVLERLEQLKEERGDSKGFGAVVASHRSKKKSKKKK